MTISQLSDQQIIAAIESIGSSTDSSQALSFNFSINKTFFIMIKAGEGSSVPSDIKEASELANFKKVSIELFHYKDPPPIEETHMDPIEFSTTEPDGSIKIYRFEFDVKFFPHIAIDSMAEEPFKNQPWSGSFQRGNFVNRVAMLPWRDICDIIRYCDKISRLKLFW
jgi:hypothetical protein